MDIFRFRGGRLPHHHPTKRMKKSFAIALLALAGLAAFERPAHAVLVSYTPGDIFIGFRSTANSNNYLINIGQASQFRNASGPIALNIGTTGADLTAFFGADWNTSGAVTWSVAGGLRQAADGDPIYTLYASRIEGAQPWNRASFAAQNLASTKFNDLQKYYVANDVGTPRQSTENSSVGILQQDSDVNSYDSFFSETSAFGHFSGTTEAAFGDGVADASLSLFRLVPGTGPGELLGSFTITDAGVITFTPVPEPGVVVLVALAGAAFLVARRRLFV